MRLTLLVAGIALTVSATIVYKQSRTAKHSFCNFLKSDQILQRRVTLLEKKKDCKDNRCLEETLWLEQYLDKFDHEVLKSEGCQ